MPVGVTSISEFDKGLIIIVKYLHYFSAAQNIAFLNSRL